MRFAFVLIVIVSACGGGTAGASSTPASTLATVTASVAPTAPPTASPTTPAPTTPGPTTQATPSPGPVSSPVPTPPGRAAYCDVGDVATPILAYADHVRTFLDWTYALPETYQPPDLVSVGTGGAFIAPRAVEAVGAAEVLARRGDPSYTTLLSDAPNSGVRKVAYADFVAMRAAASAAGHPLVVISAYRSFALQVTTFNYWVGVGGYQQALRTSARPGHSEHQLGTAIDFGDGTAAPWEYEDWATTPTGAWLAAHAAEFGFVMSFQKGKTNVTCYDYEPWHYRWVGTQLAQTVSEARVTLREYQSAALR